MRAPATVALTLLLATATTACGSDDAPRAAPSPPTTGTTASPTPTTTTQTATGTTTASTPATPMGGTTTPPSTSAPATSGPVSTAPATTSPAAPAPVTPTVIASGLQVPWGLAFLPDGSALVSERDTASIHQVRPDGRRTLAADVPGVAASGEGGLLGLAVSPTYSQDRWVYAYYTGVGDNRIVRFRLATPGTQEIVLSGIPKAGNHNGGRLAFGPDGMLYAGTGDAGDTSRSQDKSSLGGKILRVKPTGGAAPGNPFGSAVWSLGHRNVQGLAFDGSGRLWASEFGQNTYDEVNLIAKGANYGWPTVEGKGTGGGKFVSPQVVWDTSEASPSGVAFAGGELHVAALRGQRLWDVPLSGDRAGTPVARYRGSYGRIRSATTEPGGRAIWLTTSNCDGRGDCGARKDLVLRVPL